ncbi:MAG: hypothetical protein WAP74_02995 [Patescibacteria group bacterium]
MVGKYTKKVYLELTGVTVKTLLLSLFDVLAVFGSFDHRRRYRRAYGDYLSSRGRDYKRFYNLVSRLKVAKLIEVYTEGEEKFIELTDQGRRKIGRYLFEDGKIPIPNHWDGKWRIIIFDIPEEKKVVRDIVRELLTRIGCYQLQKSVYVYPHDCIGMVRYLEQTYGINHYVQFIIAERVETELDLIEYFSKRNIIKSIKRQSK